MAKGKGKEKRTNDDWQNTKMYNTENYLICRLVVSGE
jgi:hypothetical protein